MPRTIGIRELKNQTSRIVRAVREDGVEYVVTLHGEPVAVLRAFGAEDARRLEQAQTDQALVQMKALAKEVAAAWVSPKSAVDLVDEQRR
jgi:prevent-host-death family protein